MFWKCFCYLSLYLKLNNAIVQEDTEIGKTEIRFFLLTENIIVYNKIASANRNFKSVKLSIDMQSQEHSRWPLKIDLVNIVRKGDFSHSGSQHYNVLSYKNETN